MNQLILRINSLISGRRGVALLLIATVVLTGIGFWFFPWISDDINYRMPFRSYFVEGGTVEPGQLWAHFVHRYLTDNGRMASLAMIYIEFTPRWVQVGLSMMAVWLTLWYGLKVIGARNSRVMACLWIFAVIVMLPWVDQMYVFDFQVAYLWGGAFAMILSYMLLYDKGPLWGLVLMSLLVGLWQEAFGLPVFVGAGLLWLFYKRYRTRRVFIACCCLVVGLAWLYFSPGGQHYRGALWRPFAFRLDILLVFVLPSILLLGLMIWRLVRIRRVAAIDLFMLSGSLVASAVVLYSQYGPRVGWWAVLGAMAGILSMMHDLRGVRPWPVALRVCAGLLMMFTAVHLVAVAWASYKSDKEYNAVISSYLEDPDRIIYTDLMMRESSPLICMHKPYFGIFTHWRTILILSRFYNSDPSKWIRVVPTELAEYHEGEGRLLGGTLGLREYKGYMVGRLWGDEPAAIEFKVDYTTGQFVREMYMVPFRDADGQMRSWYVMNASTLRALIEPIPLAVSYNE